jgi:septal ring factor EnvC (AmiA/AmiB activator)
VRAILLIPILALFTACAGPRISHVKYSAPSAMPVRRAVANAQDHAKKAKQDVEDAKKAEGDGLQLALSDADHEIDQLTAELLTAQSALTDLESKTEILADNLNHAIDEKNAALLERDAANVKIHTASRKLWHTRFLLLGALVWIFRTPLLALGKMLVGLIAKIP